MGHDHGHSHAHDPSHEPTPGADVPPALDLSVPDGDLAPGDLSRRGFLRRAGLLGGGVLGGGVLAGGLAAVGVEAAHVHGDRGAARQAGYAWLAGDHHIHTQYSSDAVYRVIDQVCHAYAYGLDWMVITDHGSAAHARIGVERVNPDIVAARSAVPDVLVFQGLEWNIPSADHGTVFVHPGGQEVAVLREFENTFDGSVTGASGPANEALAVAGVTFLGAAVRDKRVEGALFLANHPARRGVDSPHQIRAWRDADPSVAVGMEGAPGHQAAGLPTPLGPGGGRGGYDDAPSAISFPGYPLESYRTFGGFDWMTATVGGLWDSLLAEGRPWWITANSDAHTVHLDTVARGPGSDFATNGRHDDPVYGGQILTAARDFWPGYYSRTHVGGTSFTYRAVMDGLRAGRVWVDHGGLISGLDVRARVAGRSRWVTLGGTLSIRRGDDVRLSIGIDLANTPNWAQFVPTLARVDLIAGEVTDPAPDRDTVAAPATTVVTSFEVDRSTGHVDLTYTFRDVERPFYLRLRGTDGKRSEPGRRGAAVDPAGPAMDVIGAVDPWQDLWFYANPIWVVPNGATSVRSGGTRG